MASIIIREQIVAHEVIVISENRRDVGETRIGPLIEMQLVALDVPPLPPIFLPRVDRRHERLASASRAKRSFVSIRDSVGTQERSKLFYFYRR
jgi:hypothetical protein